MFVFENHHVKKKHIYKWTSFIVISVLLQAKPFFILRQIESLFFSSNSHMIMIYPVFSCPKSGGRAACHWKNTFEFAALGDGLRTKELHLEGQDAKVLAIVCWNTLHSYDLCANYTIIHSIFLYFLQPCI